MITSVQNPRVKEAARLRDGRHRQKQRRILIDGARELGRALAAGLSIGEVFVCQELIARTEKGAGPICRNGAPTAGWSPGAKHKLDQSPFPSQDAQRLLAALGRGGAEIIDVSEPVFAKLSFGDRAEGVIGVADMPGRRLAELTLPQRPLVAVLEGVEKPGNVGAVLRSADGAGVSAVLLADPATDLYNPNAIRASLGTIFTVPVCQASGREVLDWLRQQGLAIFTAHVEGSQLYTEADYRGPAAIVLGSEAKGLTPLWAGDDVRAIRLPMLGAADSLNVSAAAAVLFYEARRQRG